MFHNSAGSNREGFASYQDRASLVLGSSVQPIHPMATAMVIGKLRYCSLACSFLLTPTIPGRMERANETH